MKKNKESSLIELILSSQDEGWMFGALLEFVHSSGNAEWSEPLILSTFLKQKEIKKGIGFFSRLLENDPKNPSYYYFLSILYMEGGDNSLALNHIDTALDARPKSHEFYYLKANILKKMGAMSLALENFDYSLDLKPNFWEALHNKGTLLAEMGKIDGALECLRAVLHEVPNHRNAMFNLGALLNGVDKVNDALIIYEKILSINPDDTDAKYYESVSFLKKGDLINGFSRYDMRFFSRENMAPYLSCGKPIWDGSKKQKVILLWAEQGLGDQILFGKLLHSQRLDGNSVVVSLEPRLKTIFERCFPRFKFISPEDIPQTNFDYHLPLASLGRVVGDEVYKLLQRRCYFFLSQKPTKNLHFIEKTNQSESIIGISWFSKAPLGSYKSIPLTSFLDAFAHTDASLLSLQYGNCDAEIASISEEEFPMKRRLRLETEDFYSDLEALTASIIDCDFVVTCSNVTAHIAGASGVPCIVLLPYGLGKHWYWGVGEGPSVWYPSVFRVCRQAEESWTATIRRALSYLPVQKR